MNPEDAIKIIRANWPPDSMQYLRLSQALDCIIANHNGQAAQIAALREALKTELALSLDRSLGNMAFRKSVAIGILENNKDLNAAGVTWYE